MVYQYADWLRDRLFPPHCQLCGDRLVRHAGLCPPCMAELPWLVTGCIQCAQPLATPASPARCGRCQRRAPAFDETSALFHYRPPVDHLIKRLKFARELTVAPLLAGLLARRLSRRSEPLPGLLVPVPLHVSRLRERGFNQATELARDLGGQLRIPVAHRLCSRVRATAAQSRLPPVARGPNLRHAFALSGTPAHPHLAIVDDVMTTGHTANELARVLKQGGAGCVEVWVIARA